MPVTLAEFVTAALILTGVPLALLLIARRSLRLALWLGVAIVSAVVVGNVIEKLTTGRSGLF